MKLCLQSLAHLSVHSKEPLKDPQIPTRPWEKLGVDLFSLDGNEYANVSLLWKEGDVLYFDLLLRGKKMLRYLLRDLGYETPTGLVNLTLSVYLLTYLVVTRFFFLSSPQL